MITTDRRIRIITGHYGSGKTEFALNYIRKLNHILNPKLDHNQDAMFENHYINIYLNEIPNQILNNQQEYLNEDNLQRNLNQNNPQRNSNQDNQLAIPKLALADLDIVNVYFRSRERTMMLEAEGIEVISSSIKEDNCDLPALSARITVPIYDKRYQCVIDLGGNDIGANILGRLKPHLDIQEVDFMMVVNIFRPETGTIQEIITQKEQLEQASNLKITGFVNNSNLIHETKPMHIIEGDGMLREVSRETGVPIRYTTCMCEEVEDWKMLTTKVEGDLFPMHYHMRETWM